MDASACLIGSSQAACELRHDTALATRSTVSVLISGESGVGKKTLARFIHRQSARAFRPFVVLNCAQAPDATEFHLDLFGSGSGRSPGKGAGLVEAADGGTLLLDALSEMEPALQRELLTFVDRRTVGPEVRALHRRPDLRFLACTGPGIAKRLAAGEFLEDLYYCLNTMHLHIPALRDRRDDIPALVHYFLRQYAEERQRRAPDVSRDAMARLIAYEWPGNVNEIRQVVLALAADVGAEGTIRADQLPDAIGRAAAMERPLQAPPVPPVAPEPLLEGSRANRLGPPTSPIEVRAANVSDFTAPRSSHRSVSCRMSGLPTGVRPEAWLNRATLRRIRVRMWRSLKPFAWGALTGGVIALAATGTSVPGSSTPGGRTPQHVLAPGFGGRIEPASARYLGDATGLRAWDVESNIPPRSQVAATTGMFGSHGASAATSRLVAPDEGRSFQGSLVVTSQPSGAQVRVNGLPAGKTPLVLRNLPVGSRAVRVELDRYQPSSSTVRVVTNQQTRVHVDLQPVAAR